MPQDLRIVIASNRGPVSFAETDRGFEMRRGAGGLAGAMHPVAQRIDGRALWIATATSDVDRAALRAGAADHLESRLGYPIYHLDLDPQTYEQYYDMVSNRMLWFANHCLWEELDMEPFGDTEMAAWRDGYVPTNRRFSDVVRERSAPGDIVLFQDYHLCLAPGYLRSARPNQTIFHFTHSSFCARGLLRLPREIAQAVVQGMLGADLVGFHTSPWVHEFLSACEWIGHDVDRERGTVAGNGRTTWVRAYPLAIDAGDLLERAQGEQASGWIDRFRSRPQDRLLVRADRTEPSKNIIRGFEAFARLLDRRGDLRDNVRFIACIYPSRQTVTEYRAYTEGIRRAVEEVNDRHPGSAELYLKDDYDRTLGALRIYDVLLVNSLMDGMNLVSKEGPTVNETDGVLVLSRTAGSFEELCDHVVAIDDPWDVDLTAKALEQAFDLPPDERARNAAALKKIVASRLPEHWIEAQLADLVSLQSGGEPATPPSPAASSS